LADTIETSINVNRFASMFLALRLMLNGYCLLDVEVKYITQKSTTTATRWYDLYNRSKTRYNRLFHGPGRHLLQNKAGVEPITMENFSVSKFLPIPTSLADQQISAYWNPQVAAVLVLSDFVNNLGIDVTKVAGHAELRAEIANQQKCENARKSHGGSVRNGVKRAKVGTASNNLGARQVKKLNALSDHWGSLRTSMNNAFGDGARASWGADGYLY
jgi:hypothetical protein